MATKRKRLDIGPPVAVSDAAGDKRPSSRSPVPLPTSASSTSSSSSSSSPAVNPVNGRPFSAAYHRILATRQTLPVYSFRSEFTSMLKQHQTMILVGETGSGKTTQIPQFCVLDGYATGGKLVACTQPRRVAAMSVSKRVSEEMDVEYGSEVGYTIRFENFTNSRTRLKYLTDGMLLREAMLDPLLSQYAVIILDEAHERTVSTDVLMGLLKDVAARRRDLKLVVMSATLDAGKFTEYFDHAPLMKVPGRMHPVEVFYTPEPEADYMEAAMRTVLQIHMCVTGDHRVLTRRGWQSIANVTEEDEVLSFNITTFAQEWKPVARVICRPLSRTAQDKLYRMVGSGMDVIATRDHRMLTTRCGHNGLSKKKPADYDTVQQLLELSYQVKPSSNVTKFAQHRWRKVVCAGFNRLPATKIDIPGLQLVCDWWWQRDQQVAFLHFLGFWLGDGYLHTAMGVVCVNQKKEKAKTWFEKVLSAVFPNWWRRYDRGTRPGHVVYHVCCPPLYEYLRVKAIGPIGYDACDPEQLRAYPHFTVDQKLAAQEEQSAYYLPNNSYGSTSWWTQEAMLSAMTGSPARASYATASDTLSASMSLDDDDDDEEDEDDGMEVDAAAQVAGQLVVRNGGLFRVIDGHWFHLKRWLGSPQLISAVYSQLSRVQAIALIDGFCRADGKWSNICYEDDVDKSKPHEPTGQWRCSNSSYPLIDHLMLIGQLAGAAVDLHRASKAGREGKIGGRSVVHKVDHWAVFFNFTKSTVIPFQAAPLAEPVDVSKDVAGRGYYQYQDDGRVYCITVKDNSNFLCQRLALKPGRNGNPVLRGHPVFVGNCEDEGDILMFLTGEQEIEDAVKKLTEESRKLGSEYGPLLCLPLYSTLPIRAQQRIFDPAPPPRTPGGPPGRKVVISTNIAETSLTIDGIVYVIDPGFSKQKVYNPRIRVESLLVTPISKASAQQRAGRAGRTKPGKCFRLYTEKSFKEDLIEQTYPEILRSNLSSTILHLKKLGIDDLVHFDFMDPPAPETLMRALEELNYLGALDDEGELTEVGTKMSEFPLDPQLAKMLIASPHYSCSNEAVSIVAMLSVPNVFMRPAEGRKQADAAHQQFAHVDGDHLTLLNVYHAYKTVAPGASAASSSSSSSSSSASSSKWAWEHFLNERALKQADNVRQQLVRLMQKQSLPLMSLPFDHPSYYSNIRKAIVEGFFMQAAKLERGGAYTTVKDMQLVSLHPSCVLSDRPEWVLFNEFVLTSKNYIRTCTGVRGEWLLDIGGRYFDLKHFPAGTAKSELERMMERRKGKESKKR